MNTIQLECFLAVAENLNFARAAEQLHITQPAVTHQINSLETELSAKLFFRTTRNVELTPAGISFLSDARDILGMTMAAKSRISSQSPDQFRPFCIGCHDSTEYALLPPVLRQLAEEFPRFHPLIRQGGFQVLQNQMNEESLHVMLSFQSEQKNKNMGAFALLAKVPICCVISPDHPLAARKSISTADLKTGGMLAGDPRRTSPAIVAVTVPLIGLRPPADVFFCDNQSSLLALAGAGLGFALMADIFPLRNPSLRYLPVKDLPDMNFGLYYKDRKSHPALGSFIRKMKKQFEAQNQT